MILISIVIMVFLQIIFKFFYLLGAKFDSHFVLNYLMQTNRFPDPIMMDGLKIYEFRVQHSNSHSRLIFRDSFLLFSVRLAELPKTFDLPISAKLYFPYRFNKRENYRKHLMHLPDEADYCPGE